MDTRIRKDHVAPSTNEAAIGAVADPRDQALSHAVLQAVLDGNYERARRLAEEWRQLQGPDGCQVGRSSTSDRTSNSDPWPAR
jgi:hypothetical protein